jgi:serine protease Do
MRKLSGYGPSLIVLVTAALVLFVGPKAVQRLTYEQTRTKVIQARLNLSGGMNGEGNVLEQINQAYRDIATAVEPSVVHVSAEYLEQDPWGKSFVGTSAGSGWVYDEDGHIVTNHHVIQNAEHIEVQLYNGELHPAELVGSDPTTDIAVIKIAPTRLHPAVLADVNETVSQGDLVFAFGSPFDFRFSMSAGVVSGKDRSVGVIRTQSQLGYENFIQVDAAINPGNSGGPLTDFRGRVIGMNTAIATSPRSVNQDGGQDSLEAGQFAGIGLAIPMDMIQPAVSQIIKKGFVEKGFMGVEPRDLPPGFAQSRGFMGTGVVIALVEADGPAHRAGVLAGDIVTEVGGRAVSTKDQLRSIVSSMRPGDTVKLSIWRYDPQTKTGSSLEILVPLHRYDVLRLAGKLPPDQPRDSLAPLGIARMSTSTPEGAKRAGATYLAGVLIEDIVPDSALAKRVEAGAIIIEAMGRSVRDVDGLFEVLHAIDLRGGVLLTIIKRDGKSLTMNVRVE